MSNASRTPATNLVLRLATAAIWVPFLLWLLFLAPRWAFPSVAAAMCALGGDELFVMVAPGQRVLRGFGVLAALLVFALVGLADAFAWHDARLWPLAMVGLTGSGFLLSLGGPQPIEHAAGRMAWSIAGPLYLGGFFGAITWLQLERGGGWVLLALMCSFLSDTAGYFVGRAFGRRALSAVSPKKTVEGSLGGLAGGLFSGLLAHFWFLPELGLVDAVALSLAATVAGQAGDLCESLIKRSTGVKDSGTSLSLAILRGHGGILDRTDAMLFSSGIIWIYAQLLAL